MKKRFVACGLLMGLVLIVVMPVAWSAEEGLAIKGLKEALNVGIKAAVNQVGVEDGFYKNPDIKIVLPESLRVAGAALQMISGNNLADTLTLKMNRAAENAAPKAMDIFIKAISNIRFDDANGILNSTQKDAATQYLEKYTSDSLKQAFYPIVKTTMEEVGAVKTYNEYIGGIASNPFTKSIDLDINQYVTGKGIDGLFKMVAEEEKNIRENPAAQVTDILKQVFGAMK